MWKTSPSWLVPPVLDDFMLLSPSVHCAKQWLAMWHDCLCTLGFFDRILFVYKWGFFRKNISKNVSMEFLLILWMFLETV